MSGLSGSYTLDHQRSDSAEPIMEIMGLPWLARKAANQITPQHVIEQTETDITISITNFMGTTVDGPSPIGTDFQPFVHQQLGDCMRRIELDPSTGGFTICVKKEADAIEIITNYSYLNDSHQDILLRIQFSKGDRSVNVRRVFTRDP